MWLYACSVCHAYYYGKAKGMIEWKRQNILERILAVYLRNIHCILQSLVVAVSLIFSLENYAFEKGMVKLSMLWILICLQLKCLGK